jgi:hypothetical protein
VVDGREINWDLANGEMFFRNREGVVRRQEELVVDLAEVDLDGHGGVVDNGGVIVRVTYDEEDMRFKRTFGDRMIFLIAEVELTDIRGEF